VAIWSASGRAVAEGRRSTTALKSTRRCISVWLPRACFLLAETDEEIMRNIDIACLSALALFACHNRDNNPETSREQLNPRPTVVANNVAADNTARNATAGTGAASDAERDRPGPVATAGDQGESAADRETTQHVRQSVMKHDELSTNAKNVKIITREGVVTLRGPVASEQEKATLVQAAKATTGVKSVDSEVEVSTRLSAAQGSSTPSPSVPSTERPSATSQPRSGSSKAPR
jgi:hyperosmotically inducible protein